MKGLFQSSFRALPALAGLLLLGTLAAMAAQPHLQPLLPGKWPAVTRGTAQGVAVSGNYAYVALGEGGLLVIDLSNPANPVRVGGYDTSGGAYGVAVVADRIYVADGAAGLVVLPTLPNVQFTVRVEATPGVSFTIEATTNLVGPVTWSPLLTTNVPAMPFDYVDFDVKLSEKPQKFYRARQP